VKNAFGISVCSKEYNTYERGEIPRNPRLLSNSKEGQIKYPMDVMERRVFNTFTGGRYILIAFWIEP
jgi:hypothetical protein